MTKYLYSCVFILLLIALLHERTFANEDVSKSTSDSETDRLDVNKDSRLSFQEVVSFLQSLEEGEQSSEWLQDLFSRFDLDRDGYWNVQEKRAFRSALLAPQASPWPSPLVMAIIVVATSTVIMLGRILYKRFCRIRFARLRAFARKQRSIGALKGVKSSGPTDPDEPLSSTGTTVIDSYLGDPMAATTTQSTASDESNDSDSDDDDNDAKIVRRSLSRVRTKIINSNHLNVSGQRLGSGRFGQVFVGKWQQTTTVACKVMHESTTHVQLTDFLAESQLILQLPVHPHIVSVYGVCNYKKSATQSNQLSVSNESGSERTIVLVMEFLPDGDVLSALRNQSKISGLKLSTETFCKFARDVACGLIHLQAHGIVHRDLACRNLLLTRAHGELCVKVSDFGLSRHETYLITLSPRAERRLGQSSSSAPNRTARPLPVKWTAPEALRFKEFSSASDVWSFGIVLYEMFRYGDEPFGHLSTREVLDILTELHVREQQRRIFSQRDEQLPFASSSERSFVEENYDANSAYNSAYVTRSDGYVSVEAVEVHEREHSNDRVYNDVDADCYTIPEPASAENSIDNSSVPIIEDLLPKPPQCPDRVYELMKACWSFDPKQRPTFQDLFERTSTLLSEAKKPTLSSSTYVADDSKLNTVSNANRDVRNLRRVVSQQWRSKSAANMKPSSKGGSKRSSPKISFTAPEN